MQHIQQDCFDFSLFPPRSHFAWCLFGLISCHLLQAKEDNMLCGQARASLRELASSRPHDSAWRLACATALMVRDDQAASFNFDARTGTDTVGAILEYDKIEKYMLEIDTAAVPSFPSFFLR
jgi:hypothetical protein